MRSLGLVFCILCFVVSCCAPAADAARIIPGPDDAQGSYDHTVIAHWDGGLPGQRVTGNIDVHYHLDFWLVRKIAIATYLADGRYTFTATGQSTERLGEAPPCAIRGTVEGAGDIGPDGAVSLNYGEDGWYIKDITLPNLTDSITTKGDTCQPRDKITGFNINLGGDYKVQQTVPRVIVVGADTMGEKNCDNMNDGSMTENVIPTFFEMPANGILCSVQRTFRFTGHLKTGEGFGSRASVDPYAGGLAQPCRRKPAKAGETPAPCITANPRP